jgi:hypothetical protein
MVSHVFETLCHFGTSGGLAQMVGYESLQQCGLEGLVKKIALALVLVVTSLSLGGCFVGKGKAPAPVVTRG